MSNINEMQLNKPAMEDYPFVRDFKGTQMLGIAPGVHVFLRGDSLVQCTQPDGTDIVHRSSNKFKEVLDFLRESEDEGWFSPGYKYLKHCLPLSFLLEVAGDKEELWTLLTSSKARKVETFFYRLGIDIDVAIAMAGAAPSSDWPVGMKAMPDKLVLGVVPSNGHGVEALLRFKARSVHIEIPTEDGGTASYFLRFPDYEFLDEVSLSRRDYYTLMWGRLWWQMLNVVGLRCHEVGIFHEFDLRDALTFATRDLHDRNVNQKVSTPDEVMAAINEYVHNM